MPRAKFKLAASTQQKHVDCRFFNRSPSGSAECSILKHPYCLGTSATLCTFCKPKGTEVLDG